MKKYTKRETVQFVDDMFEQGYEVQHYHGRFYWEGPAVSVRDTYELADVVASTAVKVQWDNMGLGYIVYPLMSDAGEEVMGAT
jgi:arabinogalactan endo-1,4-beta-galactosidase